MRMEVFGIVIRGCDECHYVVLKGKEILGCCAPREHRFQKSCWVPHGYIAITDEERCIWEQKMKMLV